MSVTQIDTGVITDQAITAEKLHPSVKLVPAGAIIAYPGSTDPPGWLICDGRSLSTLLYPSLFAAIQYTFGGSGNSFNIPNLRNQFIRGYGAGFSGTFGQAVQDSYLNHAHAATTTDSANSGHGHSINIGNSFYTPNNADQRRAVGNLASDPLGVTGQVNSFATYGINGGDGAHSHTITISNNSDATAETFPRHRIMNFCISL